MSRYACDTVRYLNVLMAKKVLMMRKNRSKAGRPHSFLGNIAWRRVRRITQETTKSAKLVDPMMIHVPSWPAKRRKKRSLMAKAKTLTRAMAVGI